MTIRNIFLPLKRNPQMIAKTLAATEKDADERKSYGRLTGGGDASAGTNSACVAEPIPPVPTIVLETPSSYSALIYGLVLFVLGATAIGFFITFFDSTVSEEETKNVAWSCAAAVFSITFVFVLVLPKALVVRSDASIGVRTLFVTWNFADATAASENPPWQENCSRPRWKFATSVHHRVVVRRRRRNQWDILVSPKDAEAFCKAVNEVAKKFDHEECARDDDHV